MNRFMPRTLAAQLIVLLLVALVATQAISYLVFLRERQSAIRLLSQENALARMVGVVRLLADTPADLHDRILNAASTRRQRFWLSDESVVPESGANTDDLALARVLKAELGEQALDVRVAQETRLARRRFRRLGRDRHEGRGDDDRRASQRRRVVWLSVSVKMATGRWLNDVTRARSSSSRWAWPAILSMLLMAGAIAAIVILVIRRITRPLGQLARSAERLGRGEPVAALPEEGPRELRLTTRAFNRMGDRLSRFVQDRTRLLAAISHDLRTPITSLRLRAELIDDEETRTKMLETLEEMHQMAEATLEFAREEAAVEDTRVVDLSSLVRAVCDDLSDMGLDVTHNTPERLLCRCRTVAIKRVVRNLVENAVAYGECARVELKQVNDEAVIVIDDDGPGIPDGDLDDVFQPFVRLEGSRAKETGGVGLGLAISRSIIRGHGGDITLANRKGGGLRATIALPLGSAE